MTDAPRVAGSAGDKVIIGRSYYTWSPAGAREPDPLFATDAFVASFAGGQLAPPEPVAAADGCGDYIELAGGLPAGGLWMSCSGLVSRTVRRIGPAGALLGDAHIRNVTGIDGSTTAVSPDGSTLYLWHAIDLTLTRIDLATGEQDSFDAPKPTAAATDWLTAIGRWLVPSTQAKMLLRAGIAVSADGKRVYTLGITRPGVGQEGGSTGLFSFDVSGSEMSVRRWDPTADFVSVTVSSDGLIYAAGMPGVDAAGENTSQPASITVYDATTGEVRLIAGKLGSQLITFPQALLP